MGQRLNIEIKNGETELANCYYHWSAFTDSALQLAKKVIDAYIYSDKIIGLQLAVDVLQATGAGISSSERLYMMQEPKSFDDIVFSNAIDRNCGLISITKRGMNETRQWEEGRIVIDLASETFFFDVLWTYTKEEYMSEFYESSDPTTDEFVECPYDLSAIPFDKVDDFIQFVFETPYGVVDDGLIRLWIR